MAITANTLIGTTKKSIGGVTLYRTAGRNIAREKQFSPHDTKSPGQLLQRDKFKLLQDLWRVWSPLCRYLFTSKKAYQSAYNAFMQQNFKNDAVGDDGSEASYNPLNIITSKGLLTKTNFAQSKFDNSVGAVILEWPTSLEGNQNTDDVVQVLIYSNDLNAAVIYCTDIPRNYGGFAFVLPELADSTIYPTYYLSFLSNNKKMASNSIVAIPVAF